MRALLQRLVSAPGLLIAVIAGLVLYANLDLVLPRDPFSLIGRYWPVVIVGVGLSRIIGEASPKYVEAAAFIATGSFLQLLLLGWLPGGFDTWWPVGSMIAGAYLLLVRPSARAPRTMDGSEVALDTLFETVPLRCEAQRFDGGTITCTCSTVSLDLRDVHVVGDNETLTLDVLFGSVEVLLPPHIAPEGAPAAFAGKFRVHDAPDGASASTKTSDAAKKSTSTKKSTAAKNAATTKNAAQDDAAAPPGVPAYTGEPRMLRLDGSVRFGSVHIRR